MLQRILNVIRAYLGFFLWREEKREPQEILAAEQQALRKQEMQFNQGLAAHAAACERFSAEVLRLEKLEADCKAQAAAQLKAGDAGLAGQFALKLQNIRKDLAYYRGQIQEARGMYQELLRVRDAFVSSTRQKIEELRRQLDEIKLKESLAEMNSACGHLVSQFGGSSDRLDRMLARAKEQQAHVEGRAWASMELLDADAVREQQSARETLEAMALLELSGELGLPEQQRVTNNKRTDEYRTNCSNSTADEASVGRPST
jgi:phage shock protein A